MDKIISSLLVFVLFGLVGGYGNTSETTKHLSSSIELPVDSVRATQKINDMVNEIKADNRITQLKMTIEEETYIIKLYDNETVRAFINLLPMTVTLNELNGNEKFFYIDSSLPTEEVKTSEIKVGDLKLYGSDCVVLFYKSFDSSYGYTDLGYMEDTDSLAQVLGSGDVEIIFEVNK